MALFSPTSTVITSAVLKFSATNSICRFTAIGSRLRRFGPAISQIVVGTVTQGGETHIGLGALHDTLIVGATLAGYDPTPENRDKLISLTLEEERAAKAATDRNRQK